MIELHAFAPAADATTLGVTPPAAPPPPRRTGAPLWRRDLLAIAVLLLLLLAWDSSGLDITIVRRYGTASGFPWKDHWFTRDVLHQGGRLLGFGVLAGLIANLWWPAFPGLSTAERWRWLGLTLLCLLAVPTFKQVSLTSCPWSLAEFGGVARYVSHWRLGVPDGGSGHCFPSGHATSAFAFLSGFFALRQAHPTAARRWLGGVMVFGGLFGWAQMARGAHYPSHVMWTAWACWTICVAADTLAAARAARAARLP